MRGFALIFSLFIIFSQVAPAQGGKLLDVVGMSPSEENSESSDSQKKKKDNASSEEIKKKDPKTAKGWAERIWMHKVFKTGDDWVRLNQLAVGLLVLILGLIFASFTSRTAGRFLQEQKKVPPSVAMVFRKSVFYFLGLIVFIFSVQIANLPLGFLTLIGAALAIGVSLGAKNTIYDYLSGLVIALEKPIRVNDCIEVDNYKGFVQEISGRYTVMRRFDGIQVLVPNSVFLENSVVNWTLKDKEIRGDVMVGVTYDSPVEEVSKIFLECIKDHEESLETPESGVRFWDFGDSSLVFWGYFWAKVENPMDVWRIASDIRFAVIKRFRENGITIAYPQRDVHLDTKDFLKVSVSQSETKQSRPSEDESKKQDSDKNNEGAPSQSQEKKADKESSENLKADGED